MRAGVLVALEDGDREKALDRTRLLLRYAVWCSEESPVLVSKMVGVKAALHAFNALNQVLQSALPPKSWRDGVLSDIIRLRKMNSIALGVYYEIAFMNRIYLYAISVHEPLSSAYHKQDADVKTFMLMRSLKKIYTIANQFANLDYSIHVAKIIRSSPIQRKELKDAGDFVPVWAIPVRVGIHNDKYIIAHQDVQNVFCDLILLSFACLDYQESNGAFPERLDLLTGFLPADAPIDPFTEKPYQYRRRENGFDLYSAGLDLDDDGGKMEGDFLLPSYDGDLLWSLSTEAKK